MRETFRGLLGEFHFPGCIYDLVCFQAHRLVTTELCAGWGGGVWEQKESYGLAQGRSVNLTSTVNLRTEALEGDFHEN